MLGLAHPCSTHLDDELRRRWRAHLCGVCLTLRDTAGQPARAATNTDAVLLSVLVEAQQPDGAATRTAGPCALRGMARAEVIAPEELSVRLGATAALTVAAAKVGDRVAEYESGLTHESGLIGVRRGTVGLLRRAEGRLSRKALVDPAVVEAADVPAVLTGLREQAAIEARGASLDEVTAPTAAAAAAMFAASARLAGRPENGAALAEMGRAYGEFAHLADALEDLETDRRRGDYNPLDATGTSPAAAVGRLRELRRTVIERLAEVRLRDDRLVRPLLLAAMGAAIVAHSGHTSSCGAKTRRGGRRSGSKTCDCAECCCESCCCDGTP